MDGRTSFASVCDQGLSTPDARTARGCNSAKVRFGRTATVALALACVVSLAPAPASAHQGVNLTDSDSTPKAGPLLVDGTVSFAVRADIAAGDRRGFRFDLAAGDRLAMQLLIVDTPPGNRLSASKLPRVTVTDPNGRKTRMVIDERTEFYEPYGGTNYFYLSRIEDAAEPGTYEVRVSGRSKRPVETVIAVGYREVRGEVRRATRSGERAVLAIAHAIPDLGAASAVDVYAGTTRIAQDLDPGDMETVRLKPGEYDIVVVPAGKSRLSSTPLLVTDDIELRPGGNHTLALHLSKAGRPTTTFFTNKTRTVGQNMGRMTFRHIAQAPSVDVRSRGSRIMTDLGNGEGADTGLMAGDYKVRVVREGTRDKLLPMSVQEITNAPGRQDMGNNRILYLWGSEQDDSLRLMVQDFPLDLR